MASLFSDDPGFEISAYDLTGHPVALSLDAPPSEPTLVLVPAETDFSSPDVYRSSEANQASPSGPALTSFSGGDGIYMVESSIKDLHEPWPNGAPEMYVHTGVRNDATGVMEWKSVVSGYKSKSHNWL